MAETFDVRMVHELRLPSGDVLTVEALNALDGQAVDLVDHATGEPVGRGRMAVICGCDLVFRGDMSFADVLVSLDKVAQRAHDRRPADARTN